MAELAIRGGTPVRPQGYPSWPVYDESDVEAVAAVVRGGNWGGFPEPGPNAADFETRFAAYQGASHGILMSNGTITMEVALKALGIGWGDEVIIPALTFAATAYAVVAAGALPVIVDVTRASWTIDPELVEAAVTPRTKAILPVHLAHQMADMDALMAIAERHGLAVVEDCAHAPGQRWNDRGAGCIGSFGSFSHQSSKILTGGRGRVAADERRGARAPRALDHRLRAPQGRGRAGVHVRRELPAGRAARRAAGVAVRAVPRAAGRARGERRVPGGAAPDGAGRPGARARRAHHAVELLPVPVRHRQRPVRRRDQRAGGRGAGSPRASPPRSSTRR